uniref:dihydropyrimidine dehydrogenase (NADP(+)) n=1 Tax=Timema poppense TaxID=170557 RepID=A0A7R9DJ67_TIMPO|nr:unnamed protein product [Timema poppensis]
MNSGVEISAISVDPHSGFVFWSQGYWDPMSVPSSEVWRVDMSGLNKMELAGTNLKMVSGLALDLVQRRVFWVDHKLQVVESVGYNGDHRKTRLVHEARHAQGLALFEGSLYWLAETGEIIKYKLYQISRRTETIETHTSNTDMFAIMQISRQPIVSNKCEDVNCSHICVKEQSGADSLITVEYFKNSEVCGSIHDCDESHGLDFVGGGGESDAFIFIVVVTNLESFLQCRDTVNGYIVCWDATPYIVVNLIRMEESRKNDKYKNIEKELRSKAGRKRELTRKIHTRKSFLGLSPGSLAGRWSLRRCSRAFLFFNRTSYDNTWSRGADGVSAINTVQGLMEVKANSIPWPAVGKQKSTTYGGVSGNATRPVGLYAVSAIAKKFKDFPILGIGGIDSAETSLQFLQCGASAVQTRLSGVVSQCANFPCSWTAEEGEIEIGSAIQNQDFTLIEDYITGLKALLYIESLKELENWDGLSPPIIKHQKGKPKLPHFGNYQELREEKIRDIKMQSNLLAESQSPSQVRPCYQPNKPVPKVKDVVGRSLSKIGPYSNLDNKKQVVALIDDHGPTYGAPCSSARNPRASTVELNMSAI